MILVAYEWSKGRGARRAAPTAIADPRAPQAELDGLIGQLDAMLEQPAISSRPIATPTTRSRSARILTKPGW